MRVERSPLATRVMERETSVRGRDAWRSAPTLATPATRSTTANRTPRTPRSQ